MNQKVRFASFERALGWGDNLANSPATPNLSLEWRWFNFSERHNLNGFDARVAD